MLLQNSKKKINKREPEINLENDEITNIMIE